MTQTRLGRGLGVALAAALLGTITESTAQPSAEPGHVPGFRFAHGGEVKIDDLQVYGAAVMDEKTLVFVGTRAGPEDADPDTLDPNGAILDLVTKKARPFTNGHTARICGVAVRRDRIATTSIHRDPLLIWDVKAGKTVRQVSIDKVLKGGGYTREEPPDNMEQAVAWFHKSDTLAVTSDEYVVLLDPARPDKAVGVLRVPEPTRGWADGPVAVSLDDAWMACPLGKGPRGKAKVVFWKVKTRKATEVVLVPKGVKKPDSWTAGGAVFGPTGQLFAWRNGISEVEPGTARADLLAATRQVVRVELTDVREGKHAPLPAGEGLTVLSCAIDPTGKWLAVAGSGKRDDKVRVYHLPSGKLARRERLKGEHPPKWVAFTPAGKRLVCATLYGLVRWWDVSE
jgi:hypothetical protein